MEKEKSKRVLRRQVLIEAKVRATNAKLEAWSNGNEKTIIRMMTLGASLCSKYEKAKWRERK